MKKIFSFLNRLLTPLLRIIGVKKKHALPDSVPQAQDTQEPGPPKKIAANALFLRSDQGTALVVDHEFEDVPGWLEWDFAKGTISIVQMGGNTALLQVKVDKKDMNAYSQLEKVLLIANYNKKKIVHNLAVITRVQS